MPSGLFVILWACSSSQSAGTRHGEKASAVLIQFDDTFIPFYCLTNLEKFRARCFYTVHKLQGCTLNKAVIDLGKSLLAKAQQFVALN